MVVHSSEMSDILPEDILYDSARPTLSLKVVVAVATGVMLVGFMSFARWFSAGTELGVVTPPMVVLGAAVSVAMLGAALRSRVVRCVAVDGLRRSLRLYRDPGTSEVIALADVAAVSSEVPAGGWSRDPAEDLVLAMRDGSTRRYGLPDDADTPGIVRDLVTLLTPRAAS